MTTTLRIVGLAVAAWLAARTLAFAQLPQGSPESLFKGDVHARAGLTCETCHGKPVGTTYAEIKRTAIAPLCARCHSDAASMKPFNPALKVDQYARYLTSTHGKQMAKGDTRVATCSDCHGAHGVKSVKDVASPVAPARVAVTCARCHSDHERMAAYRLPDVPSDWSHSVHAAALQRGDLSAATCSTCHSAHGGLPEGVAKLDQVCWTCHVREAEMYKASPKMRIFAETDHPGCVTCHEEHKIVPPTDAFVGMKGKAVCAVCHDADMKGAAEILLVQQGLGRLTASISRAATVLDRAERVGMYVEDGRQVLHDAQEHQIQARVSVHTFAAKPFSAPADLGVKEAEHAEAIGTQALADLQVRRKGLAVATVLILGFLATLWIRIRQLPPIDKQA
jgi:predicted CXXCH cytochrome family protein